MRNSRATTLMFLGVIAATVMATVPAHAATITDTFYGVVAANDQAGDTSTLDIGQSFVLTVSFTKQSSNCGGCQVTGGTYYGGSNPITSIGLKVNGVTYTLPSFNSSDLSYSNDFFSTYYGVNEPGTLGFQDFNYSPVNQGTITSELSMVLNGISKTNLNMLNAPLPAMQASNGDFVVNDGNGAYANFINYSTGADLALNVQSINALPSTPAPTPEPSSLALLGTGLVGLAGLVRRRMSL